MNVFRRKSVTQLQAEALTDTRLKRALGATNLTALGIGAIIGTGIFVLTGTVAAQNAGPAVILSFVLAGVASIFAALCYSEFASLVPMAGSAYTYGYATLGELFAWIIGWDLVLEYAFISLPRYRRRAERSLLWRTERKLRPSSICQPSSLSLSLRSCW